MLIFLVENTYEAAKATIVVATVLVAIIAAREALMVATAMATIMPLTFEMATPTKRATLPTIPIAQPMVVLAQVATTQAIIAARVAQITGHKEQTSWQM